MRPVHDLLVRPRVRLVVVLSGAAVALVACRDAPPADRSAPPVASSSTPAGPAQSRSFIAPALDHPRWARGGSERDTLFSFVRTLAVDDRHLYVLDADTHQLTALRLDDGSLDWQVGGPRDSSVAPVALAAAPHSGVVVADATHSRLLTVDGAGHHAASIPFALSAAARSLCPLADGSVVVAGADPSGALLHVAPHDPAPSRIPLPWPDLASRHRLSTQLTLAASSRDPTGCVVALALGRGFALFDGTDYTARQRYVESFDLPGVVTTTTGDSAAFTRIERLADSRTAAHDVATSPTRVVVAFDGSSPIRGRVLDFYDRRTGAYTGSAPFPGRISAVADDGRDLYVAFTRHGRAAVAAFRFPSPAPRADSAAAPPPPLTAR